jgi:hypothetical protein
MSECTVPLSSANVQRTSKNPIWHGQTCSPLPLTLCQLFPYDNGLPFDIAVAAKLDRDTSEFKRKERFLELGPFSGAEWFQEVAKSKLMVRSSFSTLAC